MVWVCVWVSVCVCVLCHYDDRLHMSCGRCGCWWWLMLHSMNGFSGGVGVLKRATNDIGDLRPTFPFQWIPKRDATKRLMEKQRKPHRERTNLFDFLSSFFFPKPSVSLSRSLARSLGRSIDMLKANHCSYCWYCFEGYESEIKSIGGVIRKVTNKKCTNMLATKLVFPSHCILLYFPFVHGKIYYF